MPPRPTQRDHLFELVRFGLVGGLSTLLYLGVYALLISRGAGLALAAVVAFALSAGVGFVLHHRFTFRTDDPTANGLFRWLALQGTVLGINIGLLAILVHDAGLHRILAQVILLPLIPLLSFIASRQLVFRPDAQTRG